LISWIVAPLHAVTGVVMALVAVLHLVRFSRWAGDRTSRERLVLILHVGYAFVPFGFLLHALAAFGALPPSAGIHAWTTGAARCSPAAAGARSPRSACPSRRGELICQCRGRPYSRRLRAQPGLRRKRRGALMRSAALVPPQRCTTETPIEPVPSLPRLATMA